MKNELKLCENEDLFKLPFRKRYILQNLKYIKREIRSIYQRSKYGISRMDSWDFDHYLFTVIENGLKYLKDAGNSYPGWCTYEEWQNKLEYIIRLSEITNLYEDEVTNKSFDNYINIEEKYGKDSEEFKKAEKIWWEDERSFDNTKYKARSKVLKELEKYINDLWD